MRTIITLIMTLALVGSASAAAITYRGTMGDISIGLELTEPADQAVVGRYFRFADGIDIPLQAQSASADQFVLGEEGPCDASVCSRDENDRDVVTKVPIVGIWTLVLSDDRQHLTGTRVDKATSEVLQIDLGRVGARMLPPDVNVSPFTLHDLAMEQAYEYTGAFSQEFLPYDFLKMDVPLERGATQMLDGSNVTYLTDPRTKFAFPTVSSLVDGSDIKAVNRALSLQHARMSLEALDCKSQIYIGFGWDIHLHENAGTLAYFDDETVQVTYLSPTVMSWNQSGELFCTGVREYPHSNSYNLDVKAGKALDLTQILSHVSARSTTDPTEPIDPALVGLQPGTYFWQFDSEIEHWLLANLDPIQNPPTNDNCMVKQLISGQIGVHFVAGDTIVFGLERLPYDTFMCSRPLRSVALVDMPEQLASGAAAFFPALLQGRGPAVAVDRPTTRAALVPAGWQIEAEATGDLDADGRLDLALVLAKAGVELSPERKTLVGPRRLIIALASEHGYDRIITNDQFIPPADDPDREDYFDASSDALRISGGNLVLDLKLFSFAGGWDMWTKSYTFHWQEGAFDLAVFDWSNINRSTGGTTITKINYINKTVETTRGNIADDVQATQTEDLFPVNHFTLDEIADGMAFAP